MRGSLGFERLPGMEEGSDSGSKWETAGVGRGWLSVTQTTFTRACPQAFHLYANHLMGPFSHQERHSSIPW